jgi:competence protein ComEA
MRSRPTSDARTADVARRRLEALTAELAAARGEVPAAPDPRTDTDAADDLVATGVGAGGRHARRPVRVARRAVDRTADLAPAGVRSVVAARPHLGAAQVGLVALVVALGLLLSVWWLVRAAGDDPGQVAPPRVNATAPAAPTAASAPSKTGPLPPGASPGGGAQGASPGAPTLPRPDAAQGAGESIVVDVVGKVRRPGIAVLPVGARVVDAVEAAGGVRRGVDPATVNMARPLTDGEQVVVGGPAGAQGAPSPATVPAPSAGAPAGLVNLNTADQATLETLPGVGPVTAAAILEWRAEHGAFTAVDELLEVSGIGDATLAEIAPHVTV